MPTTSNGEIVSALGVGKCYQHYERPADRLLHLFGRRGAAPQEFWALDDVTLRVRRGEAWGVIGLNGAGKSTLLKLVAGVTVPTRGSVTVTERVGALLELGAGFHPEYSGRDNAYLAAAMLGLSARELRERLRAIEEFAGLGDAFERPVRTYSSGMFMRLAFSVATATDPAILVADEVLAVGDEPFQRRCIRRIEAFLADGGTLLFCSHSMYHVRKLCGQAIWLDGGRSRLAGPVAEVVEAYEDHLRALEGDVAAPAAAATARPDAGFQSRIVEAAVAGADGGPRAEFRMGETVVVTFEVETAPADDEVPVVAVGVVRNDGVPVYGIFSDIDGAPPARVGPRRFRVRYELPDLALLPGGYTLRLHVLDTSGLRMFDSVERPVAIRGDTREIGVVRLPHRWGG